MKGKDVRNADGKIGDVNEVLAKEQGEVVGVTVDVGGLLGWREGGHGRPGSARASGRLLGAAQPVEAVPRSAPVIEAPTGLRIFPGEIVVLPKKWAESHYNLKRWTPMTGGGHFAPAEEPEQIIEDIRAVFRSLRS